MAELRSLRLSQHLVLRPLFSIFTLFFIALAVLQASGRLAAGMLHLFEDDVNTVLFSRNISVDGLRGDWQGLNPVIVVEHLRLPAGRVRGVDLELDLLESLLRGAWVPRRLHVEGIELDVDQTAQGWRLRGMDPEQPPIDWQSLLQVPLRHVDDLALQVGVTLHGAHASAPAQLFGNIESVNRGGRHYVHAVVSNPQADAEALRLFVWEQDALLWVTESINTVSLDGQLRLPNLLLPRSEQALADRSELQLVVDQGYWTDAAGTGAGTLTLALEGLQIAPAGRTHEVSMRIDAQRRQHVVDAVTSQFSIAAERDVLDLSGVRLSVQLPEQTITEFEIARQLLTGEVTPPMVRLWRGHLDLTRVGEFLAVSAANLGAAGRWIEAMAVRGDAKNVHAYYDPETGLGYRASISDLHLQGYKGAPTLVRGQGVLWGYNQGIAMQLNASDVEVQFPDLFHDQWAMDRISGVVKAWFGENYFALQGSQLKAYMDSTGIAGRFSLTRPNERYEQRVGLLLNVDAVDLSTARTYIPYKIPPQLSDWLAFGPQDGHIHDARFVYHGQVHVQPGVPGRRIELQARLSDGVVRYDRAWPQVTDLAAQVHVAGSVTRANVESGQSLGIDLSGTRVAIVDNGLYADLDLQAAGDGDRILDFIRGSPLQNNLNFVTPSWQSAGRMRFDGELVVPLKDPLKEQSAPSATTGSVVAAPPLAVNLNLELAGVDLVMPEYRMQVANLEGAGQFRLPHHLTGQFNAEVFAQPAQITAASDNNWLWFDIDGKATPEDVYGLIEYAGQAPLKGDFAFNSRLNIAVGGGVTNLAMTSDLTGLEVGLPGEFGKSAEASVPLELDVQFLSDYQSLRWQYQTTNGWLHVGDGIEGGAIGINQPPPMTARENQAILISGRMAQLDLGEWVGTDGESSFALPVDWTLRNLAVEEFVVDELSFPQLALSGSQRGTDLAFEFAGAQLQGEVLVPAAGRLQIDLDYLALPAAATAAVQAGLPVGSGAAAPTQTQDGGAAQDPLSVEVGRSLPAADVRVARLDLGDQPFGSWQFTLQPEEDRLVLAPFIAEVNGVHFHDSRIVWDLATNRSSFNGSMKLDDLEQTLPQWGYAASLQTTAATMGADAHWPGSPANLNLLELVGQLELNASDGRFLEVEGGQGGLRILSLINFSKIAKRISFDFSDVVGSGISFDTIEAQVELDAGSLRFVEPMLVDSSSGIFQVGGRVNLDTGQLDNEMIVTLPVSNSLPWYGVYLALANPLAGLGVLVGERVLRNPIKQFSSAKFEVSGTLDEPKVQFVSLWDRSMRDSAPGEDPADLNAPAGDPAGAVQDATLGNAHTLPLNAPGD